MMGAIEEPSLEILGKRNDASPQDKWTAERVLSIRYWTPSLLLGARWLLWQPQVALRRLDVGIMYLGYLAIIAQLLIEFLGQFGGGDMVGAVSVHLFTFGAMGLITPAMIVRISRGHTGRKVAFDGLDKAALWLMLAGLFVRVLVPQLAPSAYLLWMGLAAACWLGCFGLLAWRYVPFLLRPRVDGKEH